MDYYVYHIPINDTTYRSSQGHIQIKPPQYNYHLITTLQPERTMEQSPVSVEGEKYHSTQSHTAHQEAYFLFVVGCLGIILNTTVIGFIIYRRNLRKITSAFLIHSALLNIIKAAYCIPFAHHLLNQKIPSYCDFEGASYIILITTFAFNMLAMTCAEAFTFGENNVGGNAKGTVLCVIFGVFVVYISSLILHLGPTLIGGYFSFQPDIGSCSFPLGKVTSYIAYVMWIVIVSLALVGQAHFVSKLYKEIQLNRPNRVSMLVRRSITIPDAEALSTCRIQTMVETSLHRAKMFILTTVAFVICWYPLFLLYLTDVKFNVSPKVYQTFSFFAWSHGTVEPILLLCFDKHINLLSKFCYCDKKRDNNLERIAQMMNQHRHLDPSTRDPCINHIDNMENMASQQYFDENLANHDASPGTSEMTNSDNAIASADHDDASITEDYTPHEYTQYSNMLQSQSPAMKRERKSLRILNV